MHYKQWLAAIIIGITGVISGCSRHEGPDEFTVLKNPPLVIPPDYHLQPPGDENDLKEAYSPQQLAKQALFGKL